MEVEKLSQDESLTSRQGHRFLRFEVDLRARAEGALGTGANVRRTLPVALARKEQTAHVLIRRRDGLSGKREFSFTIGVGTLVQDLAEELNAYICRVEKRSGMELPEVGELASVPPEWRLSDDRRQHARLRLRVVA